MINELKHFPKDVCNEYNFSLFIQKLTKIHVQANEKSRVDLTFNTRNDATNGQQKLLSRVMADMFTLVETAGGRFSHAARLHAG